MAKGNVLAGVVALGVLGGGGGFVAAPYLAASRMDKAIQEENVRDLTEVVDFPALRSSVQANVLRDVPAPLGALGASLVGGVVDRMVTPEAMIQLFRRRDAAQKGHEVGFEGLSAFVIRVGEGSNRAVLVMHRQGLFTWKLDTVRELPKPDLGLLR